MVRTISLFIIDFVPSSLILMCPYYFMKIYKYIDVILVDYQNANHNSGSLDT